MRVPGKRRFEYEFGVFGDLNVALKYIVVKMLKWVSTGNTDVELDEDSDDGAYYDYNSDGEDIEMEPTHPETVDPEHFEFSCLTTEEVERFFKKHVDSICASIPVKPSVAKLLLHTHRWTASNIITAYKRNAPKLLIDSRIKPLEPPEVDIQGIRECETVDCPVCLLSYSGECFRGLDCGHFFCKDCWYAHFEMQISQGITTSMECMGESCHLLVHEDCVLGILNKSTLREKYKLFSFTDYVRSHPFLRFCPGVNCNLVIFAKECQAKRVVCKQCDASFCFKCGGDYHAPTDCDIIKKWLTKCADDSETANYISAFTKDCPKCGSTIEKNGGCNHMLCASCKSHFCWMCLKDWNSHGGQIFVCNIFRQNPQIADESAHAKALEALKKYLFYYSRWENHARSLRLEKEAHQKIINRINEKVMACEGTWIDWQYLKDAGSLLVKCRYTLQYTYPFAYYMESGPRKTLFEYQQAQLEAEIENLSWKIETGEAERGELENQMNVAEKRRTTLLKDFFHVEISAKADEGSIANIMKNVMRKFSPF